MKKKSEDKGYGLVDQMRLIIRGRKVAYQQTFEGHGAPEAVLADLARFCRANETTFHPDPRMHAVLEGRREVFLRIVQHLNLNAEEIFNLTLKGK